jgi:hypothetical protein
LAIRIRRFRRLVRGWANNVIAEVNKYKNIVVSELNFLDFEAENRCLDEDERLRMKSLARELDKLWVWKRSELDRDQGTETS